MAAAISVAMTLAMTVSVAVVMAVAMAVNTTNKKSLVNFTVSPCILIH